MIALSDLESQMGLDAGEDIERLIALEKAAVAFVQTTTHQYFGPEEATTVYLKGDGTRHLWLPDLPLVDAGGSWDAVEVTEREYPGATDTDLVEDDDFTTRITGRAAYLARLGGYLWINGYEYEVTYSRGYPTNAEPTDIAAPDDIRQLVIDLVAYRYQLLGQEAVRSETIGGYSYTRFGAGDLDAIPGARDIIDAWRRPVFA